MSIREENGSGFAASQKVGRGRGGTRWVMAGIVVGALVVRLVCVLQTREVPLARHLIGDAAGYVRWAARIAGGDWIGREAFYQAPLYPYILAVWFKLLGVAVWPVRVIQCVMGAASVWCLYVGTRSMLGRRVAALAALMLALYAPAIYFDGIVQKASLGCLLVCVLIAVLSQANRVQTKASAALLGAVVGLLVLTRENAMVWAALLPVWIVLSWRGRRWGHRMGSVGGFAVGVGIVLGPVVVRNAAVSGEWSVSTFQAGPNFYIGNHRGADGRYVPLVRGHETPTFERRDATVLAERALGRHLSPRAVSRFWLSRAWDDIRDDPVAWLGLMGRKILLVWNRYEVPDAESLYVYEDASWLLGVLGSVWHFGILVPLAAVGIVSTRCQWRRLWVYYALIGSMAAAVALFFVMARYRFPLVPLLIPFAAVGVLELWRWVRAVAVAGRAPFDGSWRAFTRTGVMSRVVVGIVTAIIVNRSVQDEAKLDALSWMNVGVALAEEGNVKSATPYFERAAVDHPSSVEANNNLAQALAMGGDYAGAISHYERALSLSPGLPGADFNLAVALEHVGRLDEALAHYEQALAVDPSDADARRAVVRLRAKSR